MKSRLFRRARRSLGFTIIELAVVFVLLAVLMVVAVPSFTEFRNSSDLRAATNDLLASINAARSEAIRRGVRTEVVPLKRNDWSTGWTVFVDADLSGGWSEDDVVIVEQSVRADAPISIAGSGTAADTDAKYLAFDGSGYLRTVDGAFSAVTLTVQRADKGGPEGTRYVKVSRTGRARSCSPSADAECDGTPE